MWRRARMLPPIAFAICLALPAGARAGWEPAQVISNQGAGVGLVNSNNASVSDWRSSDVAVGANGLATALFFQQRTGGFYDPYFARRAADASTWSAPAKAALPAQSGQFGYPLELAANGAGDVVATWRLGTPWQASYWADAP